MVDELTDQFKCDHPYLLEEDDKMESKYKLITDKEDVIRWRNMKQYILDSLDAHAQHIINYQKVAVTKIFESVFEELGNVTNKLVDSGFADRNHVDSIYNAYQPTFHSIRDKYYSGFSDKEDLWFKVIQYMRGQIKQCYVFLLNSTCLWDNHNKRMQYVKDLILEDLGYTFTKNDNDYSESGLRLNATIDTIRIAPNVDELDKAFLLSTKMLQQMELLCSNQCASEIVIIDKYEYLLDTDLILLEIERFLQRYSQYSIGNHHFLHKNISMIFTNDKLPVGMEQCKCQITSINNWMFGIWETIFNYKDVIEERTLEEFRAWREVNVSQIIKRKDLKLVVINKLYSRIKKHIYETRLAELKYITDRYRRHVAHLDKEIAGLREKRDEHEKNYQSTLQERNKKVDEIVGRLVRLNKFDEILSLISQLNILCLIYKEKELTFTNNYQDFYNFLFNKCKKSNSDFHRSIRLFSENGMFSTRDALEFSKNVKEAEKKIVNTFKNFQKDTIVRQIKLTKDLDLYKDKIIDRVLIYKEEYAFIEKMAMKNDNIQNELLNEIEYFKRPLEILDKYVSHFKELGLNNIGMYSYVQQYARNFSDIMDLLEKVHRMLLHPTPVTAALNFSISALSSRSKSTKSTSTKSTATKSTATKSTKSTTTKSTKSTATKSTKSTGSSKTKSDKTSTKSVKSMAKSEGSVKSGVGSGSPTSISTVVSRKSRRSTKSASNPYRHPSLKTSSGSGKSESIKARSTKSPSSKESAGSPSKKSGSSKGKKSKSEKSDSAKSGSAKSGSAKSGSAKSQSSKSSKSTSTKSSADAEKGRYVLELFSKTPIVNSSQLSRVYACIFNYFSDAVDISKFFYDGRTSLMEKDRLKPTFEEFVSDLTGQCKNYLMQTELVWLDLVASFLRLINELANFTNHFYNESVTETYNKNFALFESSLTNNTSRTISEVSDSLTEKYLFVHKQLKPLHGHPNNKHLLEALEKEFLAIEGSLDCNAIAQNLREELFNTLQEKKGELNTTYQTLKKYTSSVCNKFIDQLLLQFIDIKRKADIFMTMSLEEDDIPPDVEGKMVKFLENLRIMNLDLSIVKPELMNLNVNELFSSKSKIAMKPLKVMEMETEFDKKYNEVCDEIPSRVSAIEDIHNKFKKMWHSDVEKIKQLYLVKYTLPERF